MAASRSKSWICAYALLLACAFSSSIIAQQADMERILAAFDGEIQRQENKAAAILYVHAAQDRDVEKMLAMVSPITRKKQGDDVIRHILSKVQIPFFSVTKININACVQTPINDPDGTNGSMFTCELNVKSFSAVTAHITVLNEHGSYISAVEFTEHPDGGKGRA